MSLLQDPVRALDQVAWYLDSAEHERFAGAFLLAAGNLSRQILEQIAFILAFYAGVPRGAYLKPNGQLRALDTVLRSLAAVDPRTGKTYFALARLRGPRIRKFARHPRSLTRWRRLLNEPSHFANPATGRSVEERHLRAFVSFGRSLFEPVDGYLIVAAVNEIESGGTLRACLSPDARNIPGVEQTVRVKPRQIEFANGNFSLRTPVRYVVVGGKGAKRLPWKRSVIVVQHAGGMALQARFVTASGCPLNMNSFSDILATFARDPIDRPALFRRLRRLGFTVSISGNTASLRRAAVPANPAMKADRGADTPSTT